MQGCDGEGACIQARADAPAAAGDVATAGLACVGGWPEPGSHRSECLFRAAEAAVLARGADALADALRLCEDSAFGPMCVSHLIELSAPPAPAADALGRAQVQAAVAFADHLKSLGGQDPRTGALYADFFWAIWVETSYAAASEVHGGLIRLLPREAYPHVHFSAALRLFRDRDLRAGVDVKRAADEVQDHLSVDGGVVDPVPGAPALRTYPVTTTYRRNLWDKDLPMEGGIGATFCLGGTRRPLGPDRNVDVKLAVLEAIANIPQGPPAAWFYGLVGSEEDEWVRWSGARIGAAMDPAAAPQYQGRDTSAVVEARLHP